MARGSVTVEVVVDADAEMTWAAATDWAWQGEWMLGTTVEGTELGGVGVGGGIRAITGIAGRGVVDTMVITAWDPPHVCDVLHTGKIVRGTGRFEVVALPGGRSRFIWSEELELPLGLLGAISWPLVRPLFAFGVRRSLLTMARLTPTRPRPPVTGAPS